MSGIVTASSSSSHHQSEKIDSEIEKGKKDYEFKFYDLPLEVISDSLCP